jgi:L-2,4-diaminobutyrate decarboxylase
VTQPEEVHVFTAETEQLAEQVLKYALDRMREDTDLDGPVPYDELLRRAGQTITPGGLGGVETLALFDTVLSVACVSTDHPRYLSFIPCAPTESASLFDLIVGASSIYGGSWLEGAGAVFAENQALRWIADLVGLPAGAGGVFVQGGTLGNLSALVTARAAMRHRRSVADEPAMSRPAVVVGSQTHSSVAHAAQVMDVDVLSAPVDERFHLTGESLRDVLESPAGDDVFAVVASAGTTNLGVVDDLADIADVCAEHGVWMHVDGAYGGAALAAPSTRHRFRGIERCDSFTVDPHKWLFAPFDACALLYREPALAKAAHTQTAGYLEITQTEPSEWNPSDYAVHLTRRARGLPFWFSLATHGTDAYAAAVEHTLATAEAGVQAVRARPYLELVTERELSVVAFRRLGWAPADYYAWSRALMGSRTAFVTPSTHEGETIARFCVVNPRTTVADLELVLDTMG